MPAGAIAAALRGPSSLVIRRDGQVLARANNDLGAEIIFADVPLDR